MPYRSSADWDRPVLKRQRDPFLTRIGLMVAGIALLIPVALIVRPQSDGATRVATDGLPGAVAVVQPGATASSALSASSASGVTETRAAIVVAESAAVPLAVAPTPSLDPAALEAAAQTTTSTLAPTTVAPTTAAPITAAPATVATTAAAPTTTAPPCGKDYEVEAGDAWSLIASGHGVSLGELLAVNQATAATAIYPGDEICLPVGAVRQATTTAAKPTTTAAKPTTTAAKPTTTAEAASASETASRAATTTTTTTTVAPAPSRSYSHAEVEQIIRDVWPDELEEKALQVAWRESTYRPGVRNSCCFGLFQIHWNAHRSWLDDWGITAANQLYDPLLNAQVAVAVYDRAGGWGPWGG